jgi:hypothetical protein
MAASLPISGTTRRTLAPPLNYVVTLDNWHEVGRGDNVVAIYGPDGKLVRQLALSDFLTQQQLPGRLRVDSWSCLVCAFTRPLSELLLPAAHSA